MLKIGVLGAGHLGKIHIKCILQSDEYELIGFYDSHPQTAETVSKEFGLKSFPIIDDLINEVDVIDIVTPTLSHYDCALKAIKNSKHVFIEKPITNTIKEAKSLMKLAHEADVKVQVGHVERFNPAFISVKEDLDQPLFIETHRLAQFNPRGTDVSVIHDLMIHDIDVILSVVKSNVKRISASGVAILSDTPDIANARIEFDNGCVANLTASRISLKNMRKSRFFQRNAYISVDFLEKKSEVIQMEDVVGEPDPFAITIDISKEGKKKQININSPEVKPNNAILDELNSFAQAIKNNTKPEVTVDDGYNALKVATEIVEQLKVKSSSLISQ